MGSDHTRTSPGALSDLVSSPDWPFPPDQMLDGSEALQTEGAPGQHQEGSDTAGAGESNIAREQSPVLAPSSHSGCGQAPLPALCPLHPSSGLRASGRTLGAFAETAGPP